VFLVVAVEAEGYQVANTDDEWPYALRHPFFAYTLIREMVDLVRRLSAVGTLAMIYS